jgi:hypothetical protein
MDTPAMDPNRVSAAPHEPDGGGRRPGARAHRFVPLFGAPIWRSSKKLEMGGAPVLNGRCSIVSGNNQPNDGVGGGGVVEEEILTGRTRGGGCYSSF